MLVARTTRAAVAAVLGIVLTSALALGHAAGVAVGVAHSDVHGAYLVDAEGMSLYAFLRDADGESTCYDQCADAWPPLLTDEAPVALDGVDADLLGTTERIDGTTQVTYAGWPLYYFVQDQAAGDVVGQGVNDVWYLLTPEGETVGVEAEGDEVFAQLMETGSTVYRTMCASCHGADGSEALADRVDIIAGNARTVNNASRLIRRVMNGGSYMPSFGAALSDEELAAVTTFVRNSWGHEFGVITPEEVSEFR